MFFLRKPFVCALWPYLSYFSVFFIWVPTHLSKEWQNLGVPPPMNGKIWASPLEASTASSNVYISLSLKQIHSSQTVEPVIHVFVSYLSSSLTLFSSSSRRAPDACIKLASISRLLVSADSSSSWRRRLSWFLSATCSRLCSRSTDNCCACWINLVRSLSNISLKCKHNLYH